MVVKKAKKIKLKIESDGVFVKLLGHTGTDCVFVGRIQLQERHYKMVFDEETEIPVAYL